MNVSEIVKAKNMDMLVQSYNQEASRVNREGFINKDGKDIKKLRDRYDSLIARFDTDKNTIKKEGCYNYKLPMDSKFIVGIKGINKSMDVRGQK